MEQVAKMAKLNRYSLHHFIRKSVGFRFILVGVFNTIFGYSIYAFFLFCGFHYLWAAFLGTLIGVLFNFITTGNIVFKNSHPKLLFRFICVYGVVFIVNILLLNVANRFSHNNYINGASCLPVTAAIAFFLNKYFVFERPVYETD
jgi:putative flippase GtrA